MLRAAAKLTRVLCARELQTSITDSVHRLLCDQIKLLRLPGYTVTQREIAHANGSLFLFEGLRHNVTKIKSMEGVDVCWVEEAEAVSDESWKVLIPTIRKDGSEIWLTWNPRYATDPTYKRFKENPPPDCVRLEVSSDDNPWLPAVLEREREYLYRVDPEAAAHVWGGKLAVKSKASVLHDKWIVESFEPGRDWNGPYFGADWGFAESPTVLVKLWVHARKLYVEREAYGVGVELDELPALFDTIPGSRTHTIRADSARPETISYMRNHGFPLIVGAEKWPGSVEDGITHLRSYEQIVIHPSCKHTADEALLYSYKVDKLTGDVLPEIVDRHNHCIDGARYALAPLISGGVQVAEMSDLDRGRPYDV